MDDILTRQLELQNKMVELQRRAAVPLTRASILFLPLCTYRPCAPFTVGKVMSLVGHGQATEEDPNAPSTASQPEEPEEIATGDPGSVLEVKHLDEVLDSATGQWSVRPTPKQATTTPKKSKYEAYAFTVVRRFTPTGPAGRNTKSPTYNVAKVIHLQSEELRAVCGKVIGRVHGVSWTAKPLRVAPQILLSWLPELKAHLATLVSDPKSPTSLTHDHLSHLVGWLATEYADTLDSLASLIAHDEITFDLMWALYIPRKTILYMTCPTTGEPRAVRLAYVEKYQKSELGGPSGVPVSFDPGLAAVLDTAGQNDYAKFFWRLSVEYLETDVSAKEARFGYAHLFGVIDVPGFSGTKKIKSLGVYPMPYYAGPGGPEALRTSLVERGRRWSAIAGGVHHLYYKGIAFLWRKPIGDWMLTKQSVRSTNI